MLLAIHPRQHLLRQFLRQPFFIMPAGKTLRWQKRYAPRKYFVTQLVKQVLGDVFISQNLAILQRIVI